MKTLPFIKSSQHNSLINGITNIHLVKRYGYYNKFNYQCGLRIFLDSFRENSTSEKLQLIVRENEVPVEAIRFVQP
jgi:hypothetical protein